MSFSKAKLQRFNDVLQPTPSSADYNIKTEDHNAGASIPKVERFADLHSPSRSDDNSFLSNSLTSVFETPTAPRKRIQLTSADRKSMLFQPSPLGEIIVECNNNKALFEVAKQKKEINTLQNHIVELKNNYYQFNSLTSVFKTPTAPRKRIQLTSADRKFMLFPPSPLGEMIVECNNNNVLFEVAEQKKDIDTLQNHSIQLKNNYNRLKDKFALLKKELNSAVIELINFHENIVNDEENYRNEIENLKWEKSICERTIVKTHKTIKKLKNRLMCSDKDVEQLKAELEATEGSKLEIEARCNQLIDELQIVCGLCDDMDEQNQVALRINKEKVNQVEHELINKVEEFKQKTVEEMTLKNEELKKTKLELTDILVPLHNQQQLIDDAQIVISRPNDMIENIEQTNYELINKHSKLEVAFENVKSELALYQDKERTWNKTKEYLTKENEQLNIAIESKQKYIEDLLAQICNFNKSQPKENDTEDFVIICKKYQELNEKYNFIVNQLKETEDPNEVLIKQISKPKKSIFLTAYEMVYGALFSQKEDSEKEAKEMVMKYAQIMEHQNQKQKSKHFMDLKKKNHELKESFFQTPNKDKENVESPHHSVYGNRLNSRPGDPLKERN